MPAFGRQRQAGVQSQHQLPKKFKASLGYNENLLQKKMLSKIVILNELYKKSVWVPHIHRDSHLHLALIIFHLIFELVRLVRSRRTWEGQSIFFKILKI